MTSTPKFLTVVYAVTTQEQRQRILDGEPWTAASDEHALHSRDSAMSRADRIQAEWDAAKAAEALVKALDAQARAKTHALLVAAVLRARENRNAAQLSQMHLDISEAIELAINLAAQGAQS